MSYNINTSQMVSIIVYSTLNPIVLARNLLASKLMTFKPEVKIFEPEYLNLQRTFEITVFSAIVVKRIFFSLDFMTLLPC